MDEAVPVDTCVFPIRTLQLPLPPNSAGTKEGTTCPQAEVILLTWLMSLVHAAFSCLDEATRMTVKGGESFGSTPILKSKWSTSWPDPLASSCKTQS